MTGLVTHVIYCQGCKQRWEQDEAVGLLDFAEAGDCACTCSDDRELLFEAWLIDPWVCYCGEVAPFDPYVFPHRDCDGGRPLAVLDGRIGTC